MRPTRRFFTVALFGLIAVLPALLDWGALWLAAPIFWVSAAIVSLADARACFAAKRVGYLLKGSTRLYVGEKGYAKMHVEHHSFARFAKVRATLDLSPNLEAVEPVTRIVQDEELAFRFELRPLRRGLASIERIWIEWESPLRLWAMRRIDEHRREIPVYPGMPRIKSMALRFFADRSLHVGVKVERHRGEGTEFESLKEFVRGDDHRAIDWKTSARHRTLLARQYRAERNHQIVLAVDSGHLMCEPIDEMSKLDHALNAALLLAWVGLAGGDRVGLFSFDAKVGPGIDPVGGVRSMPTLVSATAEIGYSDSETNFTLGLTTLAQRLRRRTLIVLVSDFVDTTTAELMLENVDRIVRRHLLVFVSVRDPMLEFVERTAPTDIDRFNRAVVAETLLRDRELVHRRLRRMGVHVLDAAPDEIGPALINRYLDIKRREML